MASFSPIEHAVDVADDVAPSSELLPWVLLSAPRTVFEHPYYATIIEEDLQLPNGKVVNWLRYADHRDGVEWPDGVMGICVDNGKVLVSRQYNPGAARVVWEFPGGGTNPGEQYEAAVRRELMEEVGVCPANVEYVGRFLLNNRRSGWGIRTFLCTDVESRSLPADDGELIESCWLSVETVAEMIIAGEIDNSTMLAGWSLWRERERRHANETTRDITKKR